MANYVSTTCSNSFKVKADNIENVRKALDYFEESYVDDEGNAFIGSYEDSMSDELVVLIDKRTNRVVGTYDFSYQMAEDIIDEEEPNMENYLEKDFTEFIQENMLDGEYCLIKEVGHEKLRYAIGCGLLITKNLIRWLDIDAMARKILTEEEGITL